MPPPRPLPAALAFLLVLMVGCGAMQAHSLLATLPVRAAGVEFESTQVVDDSPISVGYPVDDALAVLGKRRSDAVIVTRSSGAGRNAVGAVLVDGVAGDRLLVALVDTWDAPAVISRIQVTVGGRDVWLIEERGGQFTGFYRRAATVYWASSDDRELVEQFIAAMP